MSKIRDFINIEVCKKNSDIEIIDGDKHISGCDDDFYLTNKGVIIEVFFLSKNDQYKFCHPWNNSEWESNGVINIKTFDDYKDFDSRKTYILKTLKKIVEF